MYLSKTNPPFLWAFSLSLQYKERAKLDITATVTMTCLFVCLFHVLNTMCQVEMIELPFQIRSKDLDLPCGFSIQDHLTSPGFKSL